MRCTKQAPGARIRLPSSRFAEECDETLGALSFLLKRYLGGQILDVSWPKSK